MQLLSVHSSLHSLKNLTMMVSAKWPMRGLRFVSQIRRFFKPAISACHNNSQKKISYFTYGHNNLIADKYKTYIRPHQHVLLPYTSVQRCYSDSSTELSFKDQRIQNYVNTLLERLIKLQTELVSGKFKSDSDRQRVTANISKLKPVVRAIEAYQEVEQELSELKAIGEGMNENDRREIEEMTADDIEKLSVELEIRGEEILNLLIPPETVDSSDIILEVAAGVGGAEAFLFTKEIFDMYLNYAAYKGWHWEILDADYTENVSGGLRKASVSISGSDVYRNLKYEGGVHRVQRVPKTERQGRIHTSTVTVAIMPQPTEIDIKINPKDLKIDTFRSSGPGGQHVNTTDSAVRIKHLPTGIVAECQTQRSQTQNKATAMRVLQSRLYERELESQQAKETAARRVQVGTAGRSEKIRTFNFKQDRVTDHRLSENTYDVEAFLSGDGLLAETIDRLHLVARNERLLELVEAPQHK